jgi:NAD(P)-dependent dehydrogenase (short-subunit alcohol dehydrogenase family)
MRGAICVVTGASSGIGLETARGLAAVGAEVCMIGRDRARLDHSVEDVRASTKNPAVHAIRSDFSSLAAVRALASELNERFPAIHVLVNNAGLWNVERKTSVDGHEETFAVNHLAPYLLTRLTIERLRAGAPSRVVNVSSRLHEKLPAFDFDDLLFEKRYVGIAAYKRSKLANVMFSNELARRLDGTGVTSNALHPGDVATRVVRSHRVLQFLLDWVARPFIDSPARGARTSIHCASSPELEGVSGAYFKKCRRAEPSIAASDRAACARLWALSAELTGLEE